MIRMIRNDRYLPDETLRNYPWEHPPPSCKGPLPDPLKLEFQIIKGEAWGKQTRNWFHNSILDKPSQNASSPFQTTSMCSLWTSVFNTTNHDKMLITMYVKNLYEEATTQVNTPLRGVSQATPPTPFPLREAQSRETRCHLSFSFYIWSPSSAGCMLEDVAARTPAFKIRAWPTPTTKTSVALPLLTIISIPVKA